MQRKARCEPSTLINIIQIGPSAPLQISVYTTYKAIEMREPQEDHTIAIENVQIVAGDDFSSGATQNQLHNSQLVTLKVSR
jgi:hypothetical protein